MGRVSRFSLLLAGVLASGCGAAKRPYANDPLFRNGNAVWGDHGRAQTQYFAPIPEPEPPQAPKPVDLPTLDGI